MRRCSAPYAGALLALAATSGQAYAAVEAAPGAASSPLPFRRDTSENGFPVAGAIFLLVLILATLAAWWHRHRQGGGLVGACLFRVASGATARQQDGLRVTSSVRLDVNTRLHVVEWNDRQLLLAVSGNAAPVVIDRNAQVARDGAAAQPEVSA
ncbi:Flagellar biosynthesis protein, FliO [Roseateles sp. YR242]|uniref:flagellar biosynthetic protein FliO n=1 Tax=Roseateles sp. YR242 TaxID=1855305 RepID=UPI0008D3259C|nr:flagellar biosynthetic protein FliO [Roseateles sp. YR242]SEK92848.1 Flagellar biosynthesis protein, FliO [Roseateles sp. YR242]